MAVRWGRDNIGGTFRAGMKPLEYRVKRRPPASMRGAQRVVRVPCRPCPASQEAYPTQWPFYSECRGDSWSSHAISSGMSVQGASSHAVVPSAKLNRLRCTRRQASSV